MESGPVFAEVLRSWSEIFMRRSMRDFASFTKQSGLSVSQINTLFRLNYGGACGVSQISDLLGVSNAAASQMIDRMVQQGLLERSEDPLDRRGKQIAISPKGQALVQNSIEARRYWMEQLTTELTPQEQESIIQALTLLTQAAIKLEPERAVAKSHV